MPGPFDTDFLAADDLFTEAFGTAVEIERSGSAPESATAEVVLRDYEVENESGMPEQVTFRDYLFARDQYAIAGVAVEPQRGDVIRETLSGEECEFTVLPAGKRPPAEWADESGSRWLVHTKRTN